MLKSLLVAAVAIAPVVAAANFTRLQSPTRDALADGVSAWTYYRYGVQPDVIVFDLRGVAPDTAPAQVYGSLFRTAEAIKDRSFSQVVLAYRGRAKFLLDGDDFREIGRSQAYQNPIYTLRTLPEKVTTPEGELAFPRWTGSLIGVVSAQMDDLNGLTQAWFLDDMATTR